MKRKIISSVFLLLSLTIQAQNSLQEQANIIFNEAIMPNDKGSVRYLHKTSREYNVFGDCVTLEDKSKLKEQSKNYDDESAEFGYALVDVPATYNVTCFVGYGGTEYIIDILSENKELLEEVRRLTLDYFDKHLTKTTVGKYQLGVFETEAKEIKKAFKSTNWELRVYMFNNAW